MKSKLIIIVLLMFSVVGCIRPDIQVQDHILTNISYNYKIYSLQGFQNEMQNKTLTKKEVILIAGRFCSGFEGNVISCSNRVIWPECSQYDEDLSPAEYQRCINENPKWIDER